jgi:flagellar P-ring protein precursor FlgI
MMTSTLQRVHRFCARAVAVFAVIALCVPPAHAERIKDLATVQGVRTNQLIGYGLVVGLDKSGDQTIQTPFTVQSIMSMLTQLGVNLPQSATSSLLLTNVAAVMVTATLPAFAQPGQQIDVTVSSLGNAKSLNGGTLLLTPLKGADNNVYAMAQGNLVVGGVGASANGSKVQVNHLSVGRISAGATVERTVESPIGNGDHVNIELNVTDFSTVERLSDAINKSLGEGTAQAVDGRVVRVRAPEAPNERVAFLAKLENIDVRAAATPAKVIINARTGSIVMNQSVTVDVCAIAHGNLSVVITTEPVISQPNAFAQGSTVQAKKSSIEIKQESGHLTMVEGASLSDVVKALNAIGATPLDLQTILQSMKTAGALRAELEII